MSAHRHAIRLDEWMAQKAAQRARRRRNRVLWRWSLAAVLAVVALLVLTRSPAHAQEATAEDVHFWVRAYAVWYASPSYPYVDLVADSERVASCESGGFSAAVINNRRLGRAGEVGVAQFLPGGIWLWTPQAQAGYSVRDPEANVAALVWAISEGLGPRHWTCWRG